MREVLMRYFRSLRQINLDVEDKERRGRPEEWENPDMEALLTEDSCQKPEEHAHILGET